MEWHRHIDNYCERLDPSFWGEPLNAITNISFILAALWGAVEARRRGITASSIWLVIVLAALIGVGSFLFHTFATIWSAVADVTPIWLFVLCYAIVCLTRLAGVSPRTIFLGTAGLIALGVLIWLLLPAADPATAQPHTHDSPSRFNGSEQYLPAVVFMLIYSAVALWSRHAVRWWFFAATATFMVSLTLRTYDIALCDVWPYGTHVFWHLLNGTMIALLLQGLIRNTKKEV